MPVADPLLFPPPPYSLAALLPKVTRSINPENPSCGVDCVHANMERV